MHVVRRGVVHDKCYAKMYKHFILIKALNCDVYWMPLCSSKQGFGLDYDGSK
jgi:hypothetical protein